MNSKSNGSGHDEIPSEAATCKRFEPLASGGSGISGSDRLVPARVRKCRPWSSTLQGLWSACRLNFSFVEQLQEAIPQ
jgi:hypothetical protein